MTRSPLRHTVGRLAMALLCVAPTMALRAQSVLPGALDEYATKLAALTAAQRTQLRQGRPVTALLPSDPSAEVGVFGAVWVEAPIARYVAAVRDIERFEQGPNFRVTKKVSDPPRIEDFAALRLPPEDLADLKSCRVGECELKLSAATIERIRKEIDWSAPTATADAERLGRRLMLEYVNGYLEGGNERLAVYRDASRPTFVAQEFRTMVDRMPLLTSDLPALRRYLLEFPKTTLPDAESFVYWQEAIFGLKPTIRINHLTIVPEGERVSIVSKMLYASHYFWTAVELRVLVPDPARGQGFWFLSVNRSRSDGLSGFVGRLIRGRVRSEVESGMAVVLAGTKQMMEQGTR